MGKKDYTYFIIHQDNLTGEQFLNSKLSILGNARKSSNNNVLIYTDDPSNSCFSGLTGYTYSEILVQMQEEEWSPNTPPDFQNESNEKHNIKNFKKSKSLQR